VIASAAMVVPVTLLAWIPFIYPLNVFHEWWYVLLLPLALGISIVYKGVRMVDLAGFWRQVMIMTAQIVLAMVALAILLMVIVQVCIPLLPVD